MLVLEKTVQSNEPGITGIKFVFKTKGNSIIEFTYLYKKDGKDIICVPTQTMCNLACRFCHTTNYIGKIPKEHIGGEVISEAVEYICNTLKLDPTKKDLLISYMGIGEPTDNIDGVIQSMDSLSQLYPLVRFAISTVLPAQSMVNFFKLTDFVATSLFQVKLHVSLHFTDDKIRTQWLPASTNIKATIDAASFYKNYTNENVEIHYTLIDGINDTEADAERLVELLKDKNFNVKFLFYNKRTELSYEASEKYNIFENALKAAGISCEYYHPSAQDIGSSCGSFNMKEYVGQ
jgi:23S rRNA (adenine2503-C2)-methyltransferase